MNYETRPPRRGLMPPLSPDIATHIARIEYAVFTKAGPALAWKIFSNVELWPKFSQNYKSIRWQGTPWAPGSRMRIELKQPVEVTIDRVLTLCMPPYRTAWISHVRGYTMEQWISFEPSAAGGSKIFSWIDVTGANLPEQRDEAMSVLRTVLTTWFDNFSQECDRIADSHADDIRSTAD